MRRAHTELVKAPVATVMAATLLVTGCATSEGFGSSGPKSSGPCGLDFLDTPAEVESEPEIAEVSESEANLVLDLSSLTRDAVRVTISFDGKVALDVRTPAVPLQCGDSPVYSHAFRLPGNRVKVTATTDQRERASAIVPLSGSQRWVVIQPQDGFPLEVRVFDEEMSWG